MDPDDGIEPSLAASKAARSPRVSGMFYDVAMGDDGKKALASVGHMLIAELVGMLKSDPEILDELRMLLSPPNRDPPPDEWLTLKTIGVPKGKARRAIKSGELPAVKFGREYRVRRSDRDAWIAGHRTALETKDEQRLAYETLRKDGIPSRIALLLAEGRLAEYPEGSSSKEEGAVLLPDLDVARRIALGHGDTFGRDPEADATLDAYIGEVALLNAAGADGNIRLTSDRPLFALPPSSESAAMRARAKRVAEYISNRLAGESPYYSVPSSVVELRSSRRRGPNWC